MNAERSSLMRRLLVHMGGALLSALLLYVLGSGPASYYQVCYHNSLGRDGSARVEALLRTMYRPLQPSVKGTPLETPIANYQGWWNIRAFEKHPMMWDYFEP